MSFVLSKYKLALIIALIISYSCSRDKECHDDFIDLANLPAEKLKYDSVRAQNLGADEYGMKSYMMVFLKEGPNRSQSKEETKKIQEDHLSNIHKLAEKGILVLAGPFLDEGDIKGVFLFDVQTKEEAEKLTQSDPAVIEGRLIMEIHPWYGSAAIMELNEIHNQISKIKF